MDYWTPKRTEEREVFTLDFSALLTAIGAGTRIASIEGVTVELLRGTDADAQAIVSGQPSTDDSGQQVSVFIVAGISGAQYAIHCTINTDSTPSQRLTLSGVLPVTDD